jgi:hypothetical protein
VMDVIRVTGIVDIVGESIIEVILTGFFFVVGIVLVYLLRYFIAGVIVAILSIVIVPLLLVLYLFTKVVAWIIPKQKKIVKKSTTKRIPKHDIDGKTTVENVSSQAFPVQQMPFAEPLQQRAPKFDNSGIQQDLPKPLKQAERPSSGPLQAPYPIQAFPPKKDTNGSDRQPPKLPAAAPAFSSQDDYDESDSSKTGAATGSTISPVSSTGMFTPPPLPYPKSKNVITSPFHLSRSLLSTNKEDE